MLRLICHLGAENEKVQLKREVEAGRDFNVALIVENAANGKGKGSVVFDTIALEILYNDKEFVVTTDPRSHPVPGELASVGAVDAYNPALAAKAGRPTDKKGPFANGTLLTLRPPTGDSSGPYKSATGRAGFSARGKKGFEVPPGELRVVMVGKMFALADSNLGPSNIIVRGEIYQGSTPIQTESVISTVNVVRRRSDEPIARSVSPQVAGSF